jgi:5-methylcytosine-specific restriction endonuclease McrBC GTP-binding regulatory subunit McrB
VKTQYHQIIEKKMDDESQAADYPFDKGFYVPDNVYIIGTMNDIDRSVDSMDFAFRRRFAFVEITASESEAMIYNNDINENCKNSLITRMESLNKAIIDPQKGGMSAEYQIGGAYFLKIKDVDYKYKRLWDEYIKGVLVEYYRGNPDQERIIQKLEDAYNCIPEN